ncbi:hypothetical protein E3U55_01425 [Filobacillus milosensis]|uniref:DUF4367 domain-containing protein n=1 Tax=Filobacillus milosensis TaxID=94137 RepID=A0A4Y8IZK0_9BACI|nr:hypothetical protein [Filobacillus milosensis]TFB25081.1 hypothetical protein E3U55_01425 [Filobacillus milosensis]
MNTKKVFLALVSFIVFGLLSGCLQSESSIMNQADNRLKEVFLSNKTVETNFELNQFKIYKPETFELGEERKNNVIFYKDEQPFILFINEFEEPNSKWFYNDLKKDKNNSDYLSTFENEKEFAYFSVKDREEDHIEVQLGIGGIKMSTLTTTDDVEEDVEDMIMMIKSIDEN